MNRVDNIYSFCYNKIVGDIMKNIIFDIGGVIAYYDHDEAISAFTDKEDEKKFIMDNIVNSPEWLGYGLIDIGLVTWSDVIKIIQDRTDNTHDKLIEDFCNGHYKHLYVQENMLNLIKELKTKGYKVYLLSNTNKEATEYMSKSGLFELVDGYVFSHLEYKVKPHKGIYKTLLNRYNLDPKESLFIDDRLDNCESGKELGIDTINVKPNDYNDLITKLKNKIDI